MWKFIEGKGLKIFIKYEFIGKKLDIVDNFMDNDSLEKNCQKIKKNTEESIKKMKKM